MRYEYECDTKCLKYKITYVRNFVTSFLIYSTEVCTGSYYSGVHVCDHIICISRMKNLGRTLRVLLVSLGRKKERFNVKTTHT